jgi:hypothetical protein
MSLHHYHAVVWIDHREARVFHFNPTDVERLVLHPDHPTKEIHHKANSIGANAKTVEHIHLHDRKLTKLIVGVETVDHPSDAQLSLMRENILGRRRIARPRRR